MRSRLRLTGLLIATSALNACGPTDPAPSAEEARAMSVAAEHWAREGRTCAGECRLSIRNEDGNWLVSATTGTGVTAWTKVLVLDKQSYAIEREYSIGF